MTYFGEESTARTMPPEFIPYMERHRLFQLFRNIATELAINLPRDHIMFIKQYLLNLAEHGRDIHRIILLVPPDPNIDKVVVAQCLASCLGIPVITRPHIIDQYVKHPKYKAGCVQPRLLARVTKDVLENETIKQHGWLFIDHPCTLREARCLQMLGVLPTATLLLLPTIHNVVRNPPFRPNDACPEKKMAERDVHGQDFVGLDLAYRATIVRVTTSGRTSEEVGVASCEAAARMLAGPESGPAAPVVRMVVLMGPRGCGRTTVATRVAHQLGLIHVDFKQLYEVARVKSDDIGVNLRANVINVDTLAAILERKLLEKECLTQGWIVTGYPNSLEDFKKFDAMKTPPNRVIFLMVPASVASGRILGRAFDPCTGAQVPRMDSNSVVHPDDTAYRVTAEIDHYFNNERTLQSYAGKTGIFVNANGPIDDVVNAVLSAIMTPSTVDGIRGRNQEH